MHDKDIKEPVTRFRAWWADFKLSVLDAVLPYQTSIEDEEFVALLHEWKTNENWKKVSFSGGYLRDAKGRFTNPDKESNEGYFGRDAN